MNSREDTDQAGRDLIDSVSKDVEKAGGTVNK